MTSLQPEEATRLARCEALIERGVAVFTEVGRALTDIRDGKLYRAHHKTFEAYCDARWGLVRSRAYQLIDQAKVVDAIFGSVKLSNALDISHRDVQALKVDLPGAMAAVRQRVDRGEKPASAVKAVAASVRSAPKEIQADHDRQRQEVARQLPEEIQALQTAAQERRAASKQTEAHHHPDDVEELHSTIAAQAEEIAVLRRKVAKFDDMVVEYERGGFENIIEGLHQRIEILQRQVERESQEKVANLKKAAYWREKAMEYGANDDVVIDIATGETTRG
ncbi:MAG TPA: hypothetical protein VGN60_01950 [Devosia sp.]|jgi:hypothetical protein|nr:hypothetical protein [Devosia sp.]